VQVWPAVVVQTSWQLREVVISCLGQLMHLVVVQVEQHREVVY